MYRSASFILASSSPRRQELLASAGLSFEVVPSSIEEPEIPGESPQVMVERLARDKAEAVARLHPGRWVLGADTTVALDGEIFGKPNDAEDAARMLGRLQGTRHSVWSAFALLHLERGVRHVVSDETVVEMSPLSAAAISSYIGTGEPLDKAGAYAIQGIGQCFIRRIEGSYTTVVGLDLVGVLGALERYGLLLRGR